jgi:hypothetical protein
VVYDVSAAGSWMKLYGNFSVLFLQIFWKSKTIPKKELIVKLAIRKVPFDRRGDLEERQE